MNEEVLALLRGELSEKDRKMIGYGPETRTLIVRAIELDPALEELIWRLAESAYADGCDA